MGRRRIPLEAGDHIFFLTTSVMNFLPIFSLGDRYYKILLDSLHFVVRKYQAGLIAYVFMPNHIHIIIHLRSPNNVSNLMRDFKKYTSTKTRQQLEGDGYDHWVELLRRNADDNPNQIFKLWMDRFDDVVIDTQRTLKIVINYCHYNPVRAGFVQEPEEWKYSSARNYFLNDHSLIVVDTELTFYSDSIER